MTYTPDLVPVERIQTGFVVFRKGDDFGPFGAHAEVQTVEFDGEGYQVTATFMDCDGDVSFWVRCGETVEHGGATAPILRQTSFVTAEEWAAKVEAQDRAFEVRMGELNAMQGYQCQPVDEHLLVASVAEAIGVTNGDPRRVEFFDACDRALAAPALQAAE